RDVERPANSLPPANTQDAGTVRDMVGGRGSSVGNPSHHRQATLPSPGSARSLTRRGQTLAVLAARALLVLRPAAAARDTGEETRVAQLTEGLAAVLPGADRQQVTSAARLLVAHPNSPDVAGKLGPLLAKAARATRDQVADTIEAPGNTLSYELTGSRTLRDWLSASAK